MSVFHHIPVMLYECINALNIKPCGVYVDGTAGGGGHSREILARLSPGGLLIGIDRDDRALAEAGRVLEEMKRENPQAGKFILVRERYENFSRVLDDSQTEKADGFLLDLGVSSHQLDEPERGFSYRFDAPLDMRMDNRDILTAHDVVNRYGQRDLTRILFEYGEERFAKRIAAAIVNNRPVETSGRLSEIITNAVPVAPLAHGHPAMRTFQAIRIAVNGELVKLGETLEAMARRLHPGGRLCVISFHSLEDRIAKHSFKTAADPCVCPRDLPVCACGRKPFLKIITRKPIVPDEEELNKNRRAHSAKLRVAERI